MFARLPRSVVANVYAIIALSQTWNRDAFSYPSRLTSETILGLSRWAAGLSTERQGLRVGGKGGKGVMPETRSPPGRPVAPNHAELTLIECYLLISLTNVKFIRR